MRIRTRKEEVRGENTCLAEIKIEGGCVNHPIPQEKNRERKREREREREKGHQTSWLSGLEGCKRQARKANEWL